MAGLMFESGVDSGFEDDLRRMNTKVTDFGGSVDKVGKDIDKSFGKAGKSTQQLGVSFKDIGKQILSFGGIAAGIAAIGAGITAAFNTIKDFGKSLAELSSITGLVGEDLKFMKDSALEMSNQYGKSGKEIVDAFKLVGSQKPELLKNAAALQLVTDKVLILSDATGMDLVQSASAVTAVMSQFNLKAADTERIINALAAGSLEGSAEVDNITESLKNYGTVANDANLSIEQSIALIEILGEKQIFGAEAGTKLRGATLKLKEANLGYASGAFNMKDALEESNKIMATMGSEAERDAYKLKLFGLENITVGSILTQNIQKFETLTKAVTDTTTATDQAAIMNDTLSKDLEKASAAWDGFVLSIESGDGIISKVIRGAIQGFSNLAKVISTLNNTGLEGVWLDKLKKDSDFIGQVDAQWKTISQRILETNSIEEANIKIAKEKLRLQQMISGEEIKRAASGLNNAEKAYLSFNIEGYKELTKRLETFNKEDVKTLQNTRNKAKYQQQLRGLEFSISQPGKTEAEKEAMNIKILQIKELISQIDKYKKATDKVADGTGTVLLTKEQKEELAKEYQKTLDNLSKSLAEQRKAYEEYNSIIQGLSGVRKDVVKAEYSDLMKQGETYLLFLENMLAKEKDLKKQEIIKKEIANVKVEKIVIDQQEAQKTFDKNKADLDKLIELYSTYVLKKAALEKEYGDKAKALRDAGYIEQANEADQALAKELVRLDESILAGDAGFQKWLETSLPDIAKKGIAALQKELDALNVGMQAEGLDPEQVVLYKGKIKELQKELDKLNGIQEEGKTSWKDTLELMKGINSLVSTITTSFDGMDEATKNVLTGITETTGGVINLVTAFKAVGASVSSLEKASAILAVIGAAIQVVTAISDIFKKAAAERELAKINELEKIQAINLELIKQNALYAEGNTFFADDKWGTALQGLQAYTQALKYQQELTNQIALDDTVNVKLSFGLGRGREKDMVQGINRLADQYSDELQKALAGISVKTKGRNWLGNLVGLPDEFNSLLYIYPDLVDANGELNASLLQTVIETENLSEVDKARLSNLIELSTAAADAYARFGDYISSIFGNVGDNITQAFQDMYEGGDDAMVSLEQSFSDMIESFTKNAIEFAFLQPYLNTLNETTEKLGEQYARGEITADKLQTNIVDILGSFYKNLEVLQPQILSAYKNADELAAAAGFDSVFNPVKPVEVPEVPTTPEPPEVTLPESQAGMIAQAITEETGSMLVGRLGALMLSNERISNYNADALDYAIQNLVYMRQIKLNTDYLPEIAANTRKTYEKLESI